MIRAWTPWERSTGPRTKLGKGRSSRNAFRGGVRPKLRAALAELDRIDETLSGLWPGESLELAIEDSPNSANWSTPCGS
jgi:hypothetical protein